MATQQENSTIRVRRGPVDSLDVYEITEEELTALSSGGTPGLFLNMCLFLGSSAISFLIALVTTKIDSTRAFCVFVIIDVVSWIGSALFLILWLFTRRNTKQVVKRIKNRMPSEEAIDRNSEDINAVDVTPST